MHWQWHERMTEDVLRGKGFPLQADVALLPQILQWNTSCPPSLTAAAFVLCVIANVDRDAVNHIAYLTGAQLNTLINSHNVVLLEPQLPWQGG